MIRASMICAALVALVGCGNHFTPSPRMADGPAAVAPDATHATLLLVRPSAYAGVANVSLYLDGKYVGDAEALRRTPITVTPGQHVVLAGVEKLNKKACRQLQATVEAGKIYVIEQSIAFGAVL